MVNLGSGIISQMMRNSSAKNLAEYIRRSLAIHRAVRHDRHSQGLNIVLETLAVTRIHVPE